MLLNAEQSVAVCAGFVFNGARVYDIATVICGTLNNDMRKCILGNVVELFKCDACIKFDGLFDT